ncbi:hypothetical protein K435DRAFT_142692 [Dendrothele bispora CBS 962.96]|uniref:Uncharacterized protein n=1 Tax=Dendrothele bispora (strain CBS 962.96) TaxID=1314807 RepID=A0A4S8LZ11_DENBC|nr:hypothetical protein K435DRAFT_142692 [Dendrothele bispora CBS 962.96]
MSVKTAPTAEELDQNHNLLLHRKPSTARPATAYAATCAAVLPGGRLFVTTPYENLPLFAPHPVIEMKIRKDFRFGPHDYIQWPQPWCSPLCHLACILSRPAENHKLSIMWWNPTMSDFREVRSGIVVTGLGKLGLGVTRKFCTLVEELREKCKSFCGAHSNRDEVNLVQKYSRALQERTTRLETLLLTFPQVCMAVVGLQRVFLELHTLLEYCEVFKPRMNGQSPPVSSSSPAPVLSAFTWSVDEAGMLFDAGIPFWFVHPVSAVPNVSVGRLKPFIPLSSICCEESSLAAPVIYKGVPNVEAQYSALTKYMTDAVQISSPFQSVQQSQLSIVPSTTLVNRNERHSHRGSRPYDIPPQKSGQSSRGRWTLPDSPLYPPSSPAWSWALGKVDRSRPSFYTHEGAGYAFPDPQLFVTPGRRDKISTYCENYLRFRSLLRFRLCHGTPSLVGNQTWRQLLIGDFQEKKNSTSADKKRGQVRDFIGNCLLGTGVQLDLTNIGPVKWGTTLIAPGSLVPDRVVQEIAFELSHLNFQCELMAIDTLYILPQQKSEQHQTLVERCFFGTAGGYPLTADLN